MQTKPGNARKLGFARRIGAQRDLGDDTMILAEGYRATVTDI
ncbi:hypothetical protein RRG08_062272 [Elysia crispata]|uniref:Uncharacterized protein n=1 Tax=Elysia crispata TaxID=231223 RepID=A0AAE0YGL7_9GAST|nr:hypothetical protein RRG08_062272 [Elysia crispata]